MKDAIRTNGIVQARFRRRGEVGVGLVRLTRELAGLAGVIGWALLPICVAVWAGVPRLS